ncbi:MAG: hypothetical protein JF588_18455 [Caulobacterales bacterium]|nr:hypothetical protein [Caulobacterales bacterium]
MRELLMAAALLALAGAAAAQPIDQNPPTRTIQCIDVGGQLIPPVCQVPGSRLDLREDICTCPNGGQRLDVAVCAKGQHPPPEGRALNNARAEAMRKGTLIGATFKGQPICVAPRRP